MSAHAQHSCIHDQVDGIIFKVINKQHLILLSKLKEDFGTH
jgi:hypothetical protein